MKLRFYVYGEELQVTDVDSFQFVVKHNVAQLVMAKRTELGVEHFSFYPDQTHGVQAVAA